MRPCWVTTHLVPFAVAVSVAACGNAGAPANVGSDGLEVGDISDGPDQALGGGNPQNPPGPAPQFGGGGGGDGGGGVDPDNPDDPDSDVPELIPGPDVPELDPEGPGLDPDDPDLTNPDGGGSGNAQDPQTTLPGDPNVIETVASGPNGVAPMPLKNGFVLTEIRLMDGEEGPPTHVSPITYIPDTNTFAQLIPWEGVQYPSTVTLDPANLTQSWIPSAALRLIANWLVPNVRIAYTRDEQLWVLDMAGGRKTYSYSAEQLMTGHSVTVAQNETITRTWRDDAGVRHGAVYRTGVGDVSEEDRVMNLRFAERFGRVEIIDYALAIRPDRIHRRVVIAWDEHGNPISVKDYSAGRLITHMQLDYEPEPPPGDAYTPRFQGVAEPGSTVTLALDAFGGVVFETVADISGQWLIDTFADTPVQGGPIPPSGLSTVAAAPATITVTRPDGQVDTVTSGAVIGDPNAPFTNDLQVEAALHVYPLDPLIDPPPPAVYAPVLSGTSPANASLTLTVPHPVGAPSVYVTNADPQGHWVIDFAVDQPVSGPAMPDTGWVPGVVQDLLLQASDAAGAPLAQIPLIAQVNTDATQAQLELIEPPASVIDASTNISPSPGLPNLGRLMLALNFDL